MNYLPLLALMTVPRRRRNSLFPVALPAMANLPAAQLGALAVVTSDSAVRREHNTATAAVAETIATAVDKGATFTADDFVANPIALEVVTANPNILEKVEATGKVTKAQTDAIVKQVLAALEDAKPNKNKPAPQPA